MGKFTGSFNSGDELDNDEFFDGDDDDSFETITLTDDDGNETEFVIIDEIEEKGITYLLLVENEYIEDEESAAAIFKEVQVIGGSPKTVFEEVEDDEEFDRIAALFQSTDGDYELEF